MVHYTGYKVCDLSALSRQLNAMIKRSAGSSLTTVCTKYSHRYSLVQLYFIHIIITLYSFVGQLTTSGWCN